MNILPMKQSAPIRRSFSLATAFGVALVAIAIATPSVRAQQQPMLGVSPQAKQALGITAAQEAKIKSIQEKYFAKAQDLSKLAASQNKQMIAEQEAVLTPAQKAKMQAIAAKYKAKMDGLRQQAMTMQQSMGKEIDTVFTPAQKAKIKEMQAGQGGGAMPH